ncbi:MAG: DNA-binding protein [Desulfurococcales archaeon]|nr:DNA-binding protein [Desulfurococcales archaeon]MEB3806713.1 DNA-binding protein [Desulfurococcales archaeon]
MSVDDRELEEIRRRKLMELQRELEEEKKRKALEAELRARKEALLRRILTDSARERLANIRLVKPELAEAAENLIIQLVQAGQLVPPVSDEQVKAILLRLDSQARRSFKIRFERK